MCKCISSPYKNQLQNYSLDYQMRRKQELNADEQEGCYQRQLNKEKVHIRRNEREATFNLKRKKLATNPLLKRDTIQKQKEKEESETITSILDPNTEVHEQQENQFIIIDQRYSEQIKKANKCEITIDSLNQLAILITSKNTTDIIYGAIGIRRLSALNIEVIQQIIDTELVDVLIQLTDYPESPQVKLEATWSIANIAGGTGSQCEALVSRGIIPKLVAMVNKRELGIVQQAVWAIGNISTDCAQYRDKLLDAGAGDAIIKLILSKQMGNQFKTECCWSLSILCRGKPLPEFDKVSNVLRIICAMLALGCIKNLEVFIDSCWALSYHYTVEKNRVKDLVDFNLLDTLIPIALQTNDYDVIFPILRIVGQVSVGEYMDYLMERKVLDLLQKCIKVSKKVLRRQSTWILSNLAASKCLDHIQIILANDAIVQKLLQLFVSDVEEVRSEIGFFFRNICWAGKTLSLDEIYVKTEITNCYILLLQSCKPKCVFDALDSLNFILTFSQDKMRQRGSNVNLIAEQLIRNGGAKIIEELQFHPDDNIYDLANYIVINYFEVEECQNGITEFKKNVEKIINSAQHQNNSSIS